MQRVVTAPKQVTGPGPFIFLAGPIQGSRDWQSEASNIITSLNPVVTVLTPRRVNDPTPRPWPDEKHFAQADWELDALFLASRRGVIMFWLAKEEVHDCKRPHAQTSRFELGLSAGMSFFFHTPVVVGIESGFSNYRYLNYELSSRFGVVVRHTLEDTCRRAVSMIEQQYEY